jgi:hypothetical protein
MVEDGNKRYTHQNQRTVELPSAFLVSSHPSSSPIGSKVIDPIPMMAMMAKRPVHFICTNWNNKILRMRTCSIVRLHYYKERLDLVCLIQIQINAPAQMSDSQATAIIGTKIFTVMARWCVNTRSNSGAVTMAATIPVRSITAPMSPLMVEEYPAGAWLRNKVKYQHGARACGCIAYQIFV